MGDVLLELEQVLSREKKVTVEEANVLYRCKSRALRQFMVGALVGGGGVWAATWKLSKLHRLNLSGAVAVMSGLWGLRRSLDSCADNILSLDGSRMQKELATIMVKRHRDNPWMMQRVSKHFFSEEVYDDTSAEPKIRWRYRNFFSDNVGHGQSTQDTDSQDSGSESSQTPTDSQTVNNKTESSKTDSISRRVTVSSGNDPVAEPLDWIFGSAAEMTEEIHKPISPGKESKVFGSGHRRSRRRRRLHHQDGSVDSPT